MSEKAKTGIFVGVAVAVLAVAWTTRPKPFTVDLSQQVGTLLNEGDPLEATSLEIVKFDEETGEAKPFKVAEVNGVWALPSHLNYPADAENQLADVAASVLHLEVLNVFDIQPADYALYGVVDPTKARPGDTGVGMRVTIEKADGSKMADFIIGKEDPKKSENRFIRLPDQDVVYVVPLDTSKLSTRFQDWIEDDLLKLNAFDIRQVVLNNYSFDEVNGRIVQGDILDLKYDDKEAKWTLADLKPGEELDTEKLNEMKRALDDLKIIDVRRKPEGLSRELRSEEGIRLDQQAMVSLAQHGFYLTRDGQLISNEGEVVVRMNDGVEYILRFGEIAVTDEEEADDAAQSDDEKAGDDKSDGSASSNNDASGDSTKESKKGSSRYIFVMARFNPDLIPKPELEPLPDATGQADKTEGSKNASGEKESPDKPDQEEPSSGESSSEPAADSEANSSDSEPSNTANSESADTQSDSTAAESGDSSTKQPTADESAGSQAEASSADSSSGDDDAESAENGDTSGDSTGNEPSAAADQKAKKADAGEKKKTDEAKDDEADKERQRIERENQRKMDEYNEKVKKAQERVKELNDRFADWYYIISNSVYQKIHLSRADILKKSETDNEEKPKEGSLEELETIKDKGLGGSTN